MAAGQVAAILLPAQAQGINGLLFFLPGQQVVIEETGGLLQVSLGSGQDGGQGRVGGGRVLIERLVTPRGIAFPAPAAYELNFAQRVVPVGGGIAVDIDDMPGLQGQVIGIGGANEALGLAQYLLGAGDGQQIGVVVDQSYRTKLIHESFRAEKAGRVAVVGRQPRIPVISIAAGPARFQEKGAAVAGLALQDAGQVLDP